MDGATRTPKEVLLPAREEEVKGAKNAKNKVKEDTRKKKCISQADSNKTK